MSIIQLSQIERSYFKSGKILSGLDFHVDEGEVVGLIGRNGAGKTTLLRLIMGILRPQSGQVEIFGLNPARNPVEVKRRIGYVAEDQILPGSLVALELFAIYDDLFPNWDFKLAQALVDRFDFPLRRKVNDMSKGEARSLALVLAVAARPEVLILDEPAGGLDPAMRRDFLSTAIEHAANEGSTIVFSSHQMTDVERLASRVALLHEQKISLNRPTGSLVEDFSRASVPKLTNGAATGGAKQIQMESLNRIPGFVRSQEQERATSALFELSVTELQTQLDETFGCGVAISQCVSLEDLFIDFVGGARR